MLTYHCRPMGTTSDSVAEIDADSREQAAVKYVKQLNRTREKLGLSPYDEYYVVVNGVCMKSGIDSAAPFAQ